MVQPKYPCMKIYAHEFMLILEIYMKFVDDSGDHIDLFSEIDRNHATKMEFDEGKICAKFISVSSIRSTCNKYAHELEFLVLFSLRHLSTISIAQFKILVKSNLHQIKESDLV